MRGYESGLGQHQVVLLHEVLEGKVGQASMVDHRSEVDQIGEASQMSEVGPISQLGGLFKREVGQRGIHACSGGQRKVAHLRRDRPPEHGEGGSAAWGRRYRKEYIGTFGT